MRRKRLCAFVLAFVMLMNMMSGLAYATEQPGSDTVITNEDDLASTEKNESDTDIPETVESLTEEDTQIEVFETSSDVSDSEYETESELSGNVEKPIETIYTESETESEEGTEADAVPMSEQNAEVMVVSETELSIQYDDRYSFNDNNNLKDYAIASIETTNVTSYVVSNGKKTDNRDNEVLVSGQNEKTDVIATGVGNAEVLLVPDNQLEDARAILSGTYNGEGITIEAVKVNVTVEAATLTMMFLAGQSNMEGYCSNNSGYHPEDSILCEEGQVYSTFVPYSCTRAAQITKVNFSGKCTAENAPSFVAGSLTSSKSLNGRKLVYPLNALTESGNGKTGPDSALAYEWHRLTGDKVWTVNVAVSGTISAWWKPGEDYYERAMAVYNSASKTMEAEIRAGHYVEGYRLMFWQQGETDSSYYVGCKEYLSNFKAMYNGFEDAFGIDYCGMISTRAHMGSETSKEDIAMTGPRIAQYLLAIDQSEPDVYMVSNVNEQWISDRGVKAYFTAAYRGGKLTYPLRQNTTLRGLPSTVAAVHSDVHYAQVAHNENGITAAKCMYNIIKGSSGTVAAKWVDETGSTMVSHTNQLGDEVIAVPVVSPLYLSKEVRYTMDSTYLTYDGTTGQFTALRPGTGSLKLTNSSGRTLAVLKVGANGLKTPELTSAANDSKGIVLKWRSSIGAQSYYIYRKNDSEGWSRIGNSTTGSYTDVNVKSGVSYTYTVRASYGGTLSNYDSNGITVTCLKMPVLKSIANTAEGSRLVWEAVPGATKYYVYRKTGSSGWSRIGSGASTSYTDRDAVSGNEYAYTVVASKGSVSSAYDRTGKSIIYLQCPKKLAAKINENGINVTWSKIAGADSYQVYRRTGNGEWSRIGSSNSESFTDAKVNGGTNYTYTVRACKGSIQSYYDKTGISVTYLSKPVLSSVANVSSGVRVTWRSVKGAAQYNVYRKSEAGGWVKVGTAASNNYIDSSAESGKLYIYTVVACSGKSSSTFDKNGILIKYLKQPAVSVSASGKSFNVISWGRVAGAGGYNVYRKTGVNGWVRIASVTDSSSYKDTDIKKDVVYIYTVRAYSGSTLSSYNNGVSAGGLKRP